MIHGFSELAVWVIRSGPEDDGHWLIEASFVGVKGLDADTKLSLAEANVVPFWSGVLEEKFRAEDHGAVKIELVRRVAGEEIRMTLDDTLMMPGFGTSPLDR